jgi:hypothetical protein
VAGFQVLRPHQDLAVVLMPPELLGVVANDTGMAASGHYTTAPLVASDVARRPGVRAVICGPMCKVEHVPPEDRELAHGNAVYDYYDRSWYTALASDDANGVHLKGWSGWAHYGRTLSYVPLRGLVVSGPGQSLALGAGCGVQLYPWMVHRGGLEVSDAIDANTVQRCAVGIHSDGRLVFAWGVMGMAAFARQVRALGVPELGYCDGGGSAAFWVDGVRIAGPARERRLASCVVAQEGRGLSPWITAGAVSVLATAVSAATILSLRHAA